MEKSSHSELAPNLPALTPLSMAEILSGEAKERLEHINAMAGLGDKDAIAEKPQATLDYALAQKKELELAREKIMDGVDTGHNPWRIAIDLAKVDDYLESRGLDPDNLVLPEQDTPRQLEA